MPKSAFIYSEVLAGFDYGDDHPFKPMRARNTMELCGRYGLLDQPDLLMVSPEPAADEKALVFHDPKYIEILKRASRGEYDLEMLECGIGTSDCPALSGIFEMAMLALGATLTGVDLLVNGSADRAFNLVGGFHHAQRDHAEGFCYVSDVGSAIAHLIAIGKRIAFVDIDAHHCNGIQKAFYDDDRVLKISLHESGKTLYPWGGDETEIGDGPGRGFNVNLPLLEKSDDSVYVDAFERVVPPLLQAYKPEIVIAEIGADTLVSDPLTHLRLTSGGYRDVVKCLCGLSPKLLCLGGGGYDVFRTSKAWTLAWAEMRELEPVDQFAGLVGGMMYGADMDSLHDRPVYTTGPAKEAAMAEADRVVNYIHQNVFPILGACKP